ncbi:nucleolar protein NOP5, putative [Babesia bigemina]|uniref:Nucleolar protein NOP5, putative n=1 Tax=Babesia bigemina TaxID=5866 RepID=A0A061D0A5_BABBI|nr:nucleolar protein NOP5, putative [Babesia bigemina]CDR94103.1 nucleolar protein NOP5, putative [Babesia bigemina]|eukprot:XP_012766289.1 nucleolar protein NOP5, putative [Babesia bigemina]
MLVLLETPAGYGLFKITDSRLLECSVEDVPSFFRDGDSARSSVKLSAFSKFKTTENALEEATALSESRLGKQLKKLLNKKVVGAKVVEPLAVCDKVLAVEIQKKLKIDVVYNPSTVEIARGLKSQFFELVAGITESDCKSMALSLSHSLARFKLKFSPDKVDVMVVQAIGLLDDLDREANNFGMRLKEWYGWHFPELAHIVPDMALYSRAVRHIGIRGSTSFDDLESFLPKDVVDEIKKACEISMGSELLSDDLEAIVELAERLEEMLGYRATLEEYLRVRMRALAPNLTYMVGEVIGARLLSHSGSLINLAKQPASTVQILGAEKALFRALKTNAPTPKYGIIYHAGFVGQAQPKHKGRISRILAAKLALCVRVDALKDSQEPTVAIENKRYLEQKLLELSSKPDITSVGGIKRSDRPGQLQKPKWNASKRFKASNAE